jgi:hypothetical protein
VIGVLLTRGHPTVIYPESVLTFRIETPIAISTERSPQAFRYVNPGDYTQAARMRTNVGPPPRDCGGEGCGQSYYYGYPSYPYAYPYPYYYYGPGFGYYYGWGPSFYFGRGFHGRGYSGRGYRR